MASLSVTVRGQVTFKQEILQHLGLKPGERGRIGLEMLPGGAVRLQGERPTGSISDVFGILQGESDKVATIEEMNEAIAAGWAGKK
jgi:hypothetical protein